MAFASALSIPTIFVACLLQNAHPPSRVSLLEPGEMWPSPQPTRPSLSRTSTMMGSNSSKVRYDKTYGRMSGNRSLRRIIAASFIVRLQQSLASCRKCQMASQLDSLWGPFRLKQTFERIANSGPTIVGHVDKKVSKCAAAQPTKQSINVWKNINECPEFTRVAHKPGAPHLCLKFVT